MIYYILIIFFVVQRRRGERQRISDSWWQLGWWYHRLRIRDAANHQQVPGFIISDSWWQLGWWYHRLRNRDAANRQQVLIVIFFIFIRSLKNRLINLVAGETLFFSLKDKYFQSLPFAVQSLTFACKIPSMNPIYKHTELFQVRTKSNKDK